MYTIKSVSEEGVYFLVRGWYQHRKIWAKQTELNSDMLFKKPGFARRARNSLLKVMPEYKTDIFYLVFVDPEEKSVEDLTSWRYM